MKLVVMNPGNAKDAMTIVIMIVMVMLRVL